MKAFSIILLFFVLGAAPTLSEFINIEKGNFSVAGASRSTEQCGCGYTKYGTSACDSSSSRIIGGRNARAQEYPWQAMINICFKGKCGLCGGTLINFRYILTAAHCLSVKKVIMPISGITVKLGASQLRTNNQYTRTYKVEKLILHGNYQEATVRNDIALLRLSSDVEINDGTYPACLPDNEAATYVNKKAVVSGWGQYSTSSKSMSPYLKRTGLNILRNNHQYCVNGGGLHQTPIKSKMCAYGDDTDSCAGDSGGPLVVPEDGRCTVIGIVSYGIGCANKFHAGVYTRVTEFMFWIKFLSKDGGCLEARSPRKCDLSCTNVGSLTGNFRLNGHQASCTKGICYAFDKNVNLCTILNAPCKQGLKCAYEKQCDLRQVLGSIYGNPGYPKIYRTGFYGIPVECNTQTGDCCHRYNLNYNLCEVLNGAAGSNIFSRKTEK